MIPVSVNLSSEAKVMALPVCHSLSTSLKLAICSYQHTVNPTGQGILAQDPRLLPCFGKRTLGLRLQWQDNEKGHLGCCHQTLSVWMSVCVCVCVSVNVGLVHRICTNALLGSVCCILSDEDGLLGSEWVLPWSSRCVLNWTLGLYGPGPTAVNAHNLTSYTVSALRPSNKTLDSGAGTTTSEAFPRLFISLYSTEYFIIFPFCSIRGTDFHISRMELAEASSEITFSGYPLGASSGVVTSFTASSP